MSDIKFEIVKKIAKTDFKIRNLANLSKLNSISPPSVFIGSKLKYPKVNVGILSLLERDEEAWMYDDAKFWADNNLEISHVLHFRNSLLNSRFKARVSDVRFSKKFIDIAKEIAISSAPVDVEIELKNRVRTDRAKDKILIPHGMSANLEKVKVTGNIKIPNKLDKIINDEIKASEGVGILYKEGFNEYSLSKILSVGVIGMKKNKRFVPTRWSITATDDIIGKQILKKIREYKWIEDYQLFFGEFMGNQYLILMFPSSWSYELFELYIPGSSWNSSKEIKAGTDDEGFYGRKNYAFNTSGGYYAARLPILEYLNSINRQASVIAVRIETPSYWAGLGVWVVRESVRKTLQRMIKFNSTGELLESAKKIAKIKYSFDINEILNRSKLIKERKSQKNLERWI